jgi:hypothetical protein
MNERAAAESRDYKLREELAYRQATQGVRNQETLDKILAMGGDATRSSPVNEQQLPDADPGLTTTTGSHRTPIDPTTAAVPASADSDLARSIRGTPTIGSREPGVPEDRWAGHPDQAVVDRLTSLPTEEAWIADRNALMATARGEDTKANTDAKAKA